MSEASLADTQYALQNFLLDKQRELDDLTLETPELQQWLDERRVLDPQALNLQPQGLIYLADTPLLDISATDIRHRRHNGESCDDLLPRAVQRYIELQGLYRQKN